MKCWKCGRDMIEITCVGDVKRIHICNGAIYEKNRIVQGSVTHYPLTIKKVTNYK